MDANLDSLQADNVDSKGAFRKPINDAASRKYRRPSLASQSSSSSSDGSLKRREHSLSPVLFRGNDSRTSDYRSKRNDGGKELGACFSGNQYRDSHRHSDRESSKSYQGYKKSEDYVRREDFQRFSHQSSHLQLEDDHWSRDHSRNMDRIGAGRRHSNERDRDTGDNDSQYNRRDYRRSSGDYKSDYPSSHEESWERHSDLTSSKDSTGHHLKMAQKSHHRELDYQNKRKDVKKIYNDEESSMDKDQFYKGRTKRHENRTCSMSEYKESSVKKPKFYREGSDDIGVDGVEKQPSKVKQSSEFSSSVDTKPVLGNSSESGNGLNAAKFAAMKAAELVNKNLGGVGSMSTEQKKKLLWGNKKNAAIEESGSHCWDASLFPDRERQEKFNKLMGVKAEKHKESQDHPVNQPQAEKHKELQMDLEKQYTAGLRRRDGRTVGLGL